jgi:hypothetical protein
VSIHPSVRHPDDSFDVPAENECTASVEQFLRAPQAGDHLPQPLGVGI